MSGFSSAALHLDLYSTVLRSTMFRSMGDARLIASVIGSVVVLATTIRFFRQSNPEENELPRLPGIQLFHAWNFFRRRFDFLRASLEQNMGKPFYFNILHHRVVVLSGKEARLAFFSDPHLSLDEGYKILMGAAPRISDVEIATEESEEGNIPAFNKKIAKVFNKSRIEDILPTLLDDIIGRTDKWGTDGKSGRIDPFVEVYELAFVMTARLATCHELTKNEADLQKIRNLFLIMQKNATPFTLIFSWFPGLVKKLGKMATTELFNTVIKYVEARRNAEPSSDAIDVLIAEGESTQNIVEFVMVVLFAGIINSGIVLSWMLIDLAVHPEWKEKCRQEIREFLSNHATGSDASAPLSERLRAIPLSAWESDGLPVLEACIRESHRLASFGFALRRNVRGDMKLAGHTIKRGDFLVYPVFDAHLSSESFPNPHKYDPGRWLQPNAYSNTGYQFIGWGAGRHFCTGMRVAKVEMKLIFSLLLLRYDFELVDKNGKFPEILPIPNRNDFHSARPQERCYLNFTKIAE